jgi:uncharacterized membrane protein
MTPFDRTIGRLMIALTYIAGVFLIVGVLLMFAGGISPLSGGPPLDLAALPGDLASLQPAGFLWLGLIVVIATPIGRVAAAAVGFGIARDRRMVGVAMAILLVIAVSIATALATG